MSSTSPVEQYGNTAGSGYGSGNSENGKVPFFMSLGFLKNLTEKKATRVDGQPPKRRGPKPDSKPALTRRQELNRQAQRTHRERKELYIKALEQEVHRLKESFSTMSRDKETLAEENRQLKQLLAQHGIPSTGTGGVDEYNRKASIAGYTSSGSVSGSYAPGSQGFSPPPNMQAHSQATTPNLSPPANGSGSHNMAQQQAQQGLDYDQAGIDFVLTLERPCMEHMEFLVERASDPEGDFSGHALMVSCPPEPNLDSHSEVPFGHSLQHCLPVPSSDDNKPQKKHQRTWDISKPDLANLMDLSKRLNLDGEITPIMAWGMILRHPRIGELGMEDFEKMWGDLGRKVRCYGFGACLEEFEVRDALDNVFFSKPDITTVF